MQSLVVHERRNKTPAPAWPWPRRGPPTAPPDRWQQLSPRTPVARCCQQAPFIPQQVVNESVGAGPRAGEQPLRRGPGWGREQGWGWGWVSPWDARWKTKKRLKAAPVPQPTCPSPSPRRLQQGSRWGESAPWDPRAPLGDTPGAGRLGDPPQHQGGPSLYRPHVCPHSPRWGVTHPTAVGCAPFWHTGRRPPLPFGAPLPL